MKWGMNFTPEIREIIKIEIDERSIQSGDLFTIMRMDGIDQMIMFGTGSRNGHTVMALRFDGELYFSKFKIFGTDLIKEFEEINLVNG